MKMKLILSFTLILSSLSNVLAFSVNRQTFMKQIATATCSVIAISTPQISNAASVENAEGKLLRADKCAYGEGSGCESLAEGNEFIKELQRRSLSKKDATQKEYLNAYQNKNYPDFFASLSTPKYMVKTGDGTFQLFDDAELLQLKKEGRITLERPTAMGGKVADLTQKPIMVLR